MPPVLFLLELIILFLHVLERSAATDTISPGQALIGGTDQIIISGNGKFAVGFFEADDGFFEADDDGSEPSRPNTSSSWYLGMWYKQVPKIAPVWVANRDDPVTMEPGLWELAISGDGDLVVTNPTANSTVWSTQANTTTTSDTVAVLLGNGNLVLREASNSSNVLWQSFDHPTDTLLPGAKIGRNKITGLNRRLVSRRNRATQATGAFVKEFDPDGSGQVIIARLNSSSPPYFSSVLESGQYFTYFSSVPESGQYFTYVDNDEEESFIFTLEDDTMILRHVLDVSGQEKTLIWVGGSDSQVWVLIYSKPIAQCDVYAICGAFTYCQDNSLPSCSCMKGFSVRSPEDWEQEDHSGGCVRNLPVDCGTTNKSTVSSTDKFYPMPCVRLPQNSHKMAAGTSGLECAQLCLSNCSCTAYSYGSNGCSVWYNELIDVKQQQCNSSSSANGEILSIRLAAAELPVLQHKKGARTGTVIGATLGAVGFLALILILVIFISNVVWSRRRLKNAQNGSSIVAFRYVDLQHATNNFSEKIGGGGFGSVFKGALCDSTTIAVKKLDGAHQGEKQFRAEISSVGAIQHVNLVKLIGFCCEGKSRLLVYEHMANNSLDVHLFQSNVTVLRWSVRYQIALGLARGLAYLHESCRDCIIHCDIKPENILLDASFVPKIADFGMAKVLGRDFSRALTTMRGTIGYLAPEWISGSEITSKIDVYSYGMVLFEIISGKRNSIAEHTEADDAIYFPVQVARKLLKGDLESLVDHRLHNDVNVKQVERACKVACWCVQDNEFDRPTMGEVVQVLEGLSEFNMPPMPRLLHAITDGTWFTSI